MGNTILENYYKKVIDTYIKWLLFLNSFGEISDKNFLEVAPCLIKIKNEVQNDVLNENLSGDFNEVNLFVVNKISSYLIQYGLTSYVNHLTSYLSDRKINNLATADFIRSEILINADYVDSEVVSVVREGRITDNLKIEGYSSDYVSYYLESIKVSYNEEKSVENYLFDTLIKIEQVLITNGKSKEYISNVIEDFIKNLSITNVELFLNEIIDYERVNDNNKQLIKMIEK